MYWINLRSGVLFNGHSNSTEGISRESIVFQGGKKLFLSPISKKKKKKKKKKKDYSEKCSFGSASSHFRENPFQKVLVYRKANHKLQKVTPLYKQNGGNSTKSI